MKLLALTVNNMKGTPEQIVPPTGIPTGISLGSLATGFIDVVMVIGVLLSLAYLVYGGVFWIQSKGNKETLDKARRIILYAIIGLIVMSVALVAVNLVTSAIGVTTLIH